MKRISPYFWPAVFVLGAVAGAAATCLVRFLAGPGNAIPMLQFVTAITAGCAFVVALLTFSFNARKSKTDLFNTMHTKLLDAEIQMGREHLAGIKEESDMKGVSAEDFRLINRALAHYDTLAMYAIKGDVVREHVVSTWGTAMKNLAPQIKWFIAHRKIRDKYESWPHLTQLLRELGAL